MVEKELNSESITADKKALSIILRTKTKITIGPYHVDFFEKLQALPPAEKIELMQLTNLECRTHFANVHKSKIAKLNQLFKKTWYWKDTGEPVDFTTTHLPGKALSMASMRKLPKIDANLDAFLDFFTGPDCEVYLKEE